MKIFNLISILFMFVSQQLCLGQGVDIDFSYPIIGNWKQTHYSYRIQNINSKYINVDSTIGFTFLSFDKYYISNTTYNKRDTLSGKYKQTNQFISWKIKRTSFNYLIQKLDNDELILQNVVLYKNKQKVHFKYFYQRINTFPDSITFKNGLNENNLLGKWNTCLRLDSIEEIDSIIFSKHIECNDPRKMTYINFYSGFDKMDRFTITTYLNSSELDKKEEIWTKEIDYGIWFLDLENAILYLKTDEKIFKFNILFTENQEMKLIRKI